MGACQSLLMFIKNYLPSVEKKKRLFEIKRKFFHLLGLFFPVLTIFCDNGKLLIISCILTVVMIVFDYNNLLLLFLNKVPVVGYALKRLLRRSENRKHHFCGLTWLFIGYSIILASYEQYLVVIAMTIFVFCDMSSALIGKNFGKFKICGDKTFEGFIAFIISDLTSFLYKNQFLQIILLVLYALSAILICIITRVIIINKLIRYLRVSRYIMKIIPTSAIISTQELETWIENKY